MAGAGSEARFAGLSLVQLNELLEDEGQLAAMVQKMEEVSRASRGVRARAPRRAAGAGARAEGTATGSGRARGGPCEAGDPRTGRGGASSDWTFGTEGAGAGSRGARREWRGSSLGWRGAVVEGWGDRLD